MTSDATKLKRFEENGVVYFQLYLRCPICWEQGKPCKHSYWKHADNNCHGDIYVGDNAHFKCKKCGQSSHVNNWGYRCPSHSDSSDFEIGSVPTAMANAIPMASSISQMVTETGQQWLQRFMNNLGEW